MLPRRRAAAKKAATKAMSKSHLIQAVAEAVGDGLTKKQVKLVVEALTTVGHAELKKPGCSRCRASRSSG